MFDSASSHREFGRGCFECGRDLGVVASRMARYITEQNPRTEARGSIWGFEPTAWGEGVQRGQIDARSVKVPL